MTLVLTDIDKDRLGHMLESIAVIEQLLGLSKRERIHQLALERCFEIIGEAGRHISRPLKQAYPDIPWAGIVGLRNVVAHEYDKVDIITLWDIAEHKIPALKNWIEGILQKHEEGQTS